VLEELSWWFEVEINSESESEGGFEYKEPGSIFIEGGMTRE